MVEVKISIYNKDRKIGAMIKALAFEISNKSAVDGAKKEFLQEHGYYTFHFPSSEKAEEFKKSVNMFLPSFFASIINDKTCK